MIIQSLGNPYAKTTTTPQPVQTTTGTGIIQPLSVPTKAPGQPVTKPVPTTIPAPNLLQKATGFISGITKPLFKTAPVKLPYSNETIKMSIAGYILPIVYQVQNKDLGIPVTKPVGNLIDNVFKTPDRFITFSQYWLSKPENLPVTNVFATIQKYTADPLVKSNPFTSGYVAGAANTYLGSSQKVRDTLAKQTTYPVSIGRKGDQALYTVGSILGQVHAFIAGGELLGAAKFGKYTLPALFAITGQTAAEPTINYTQRIAKMPVDVVAGWLLNAIPGSRNFISKQALKSLSKTAGILSGQTFVDSLIEGLSPKEAARAAATQALFAALFHITGSATGLLKSKLLDNIERTGKLTMTPAQARDLVINSNLENTPLGKGIIKKSLQAETEGNLIEIGGWESKKTKLAELIKYKTPEGVTVYVDSVPKPYEAPPEEGVKPEEKAVIPAEVKPEVKPGEKPTEISLKEQENIDFARKLVKQKNLIQQFQEGKISQEQFNKELPKYIPETIETVKERYTSAELNTKVDLPGRPDTTIADLIDLYPITLTTENIDSLLAGNKTELSVKGEKVVIEPIVKPEKKVVISEQSVIDKSYSAESIAMKNQIKKPVEINGKLYISTGGFGKEVTEVIPASEYKGETTTYSTKVITDKMREENTFYDGMKVKYGKIDYVLGKTYETKTLTEIKPEEKPIKAVTPEEKPVKGVKNEFKVGDVLDPQGHTNMVGKVTIREIIGNTLKFTDSEGTKFFGMQRSLIRDLIKGGSWKRITKEKFITVGQDIKDLDAQIRTIKEPTKENPDWVVEIGLQESLGEQGGDILRLEYTSQPTLNEVRKDILDEYENTKIEINKEVAMGIVAKSGRDEMIESAIDKILAIQRAEVSKEIKPKIPEVITQKVVEPIKEGIKIIDKPFLQVSVKEENGKWTAAVNANNTNSGFSIPFQPHADKFLTQDEALSNIADEIIKNFSRKEVVLVKKTPEQIELMKAITQDILVYAKELKTIPAEVKQLPYDPSRLEKTVMPPGTFSNPSDKWEAQIRYKGWAADRKGFDTEAEAQRFIDDYEFKGINKSVADVYAGTPLEEVVFRKPKVDIDLQRAIDMAKLAKTPQEFGTYFKNNPEEIDAMEKAIREGKYTNWMDFWSKATGIPLKQKVIIAPVKNLPKIYNALNKKAGKQLPILNYVQVDKGNLYFTDLNTEVKLNTDLPDGVYSLIGKEFVKKTVKTEDLVAHFPELTQKVLEVEVLPLTKLLKEASLYTNSWDESRPILGGAKVWVEKDKMTVAGTDGYRLFLKSIPVTGGKEGSFIVSDIKNLQSLLGVLGEGKVNFMRGTKEQMRVGFESDTGTITTREVEGEFPKFENVMPNFTKQFEVDKKEFEAAINTVTPYAKESSNIMKMTLKGNQLIISASMPDETNPDKPLVKEVILSVREGKTIDIPAKTVSEGVIVMPVRIQEGEGVADQVILNYRFALDVVKVFDGNQLIIRFAGDTKDLKPVYFSDKPEKVIAPVEEEKPIIPPIPKTTPKEEKPDTYDNPFSVGWFAQVENVTKNIGKLNVIEFPEILRLAKELMGGVPLVKMTRSMKNAFIESGGMKIMGGLFRPVGKGKIILNPEIFKDPSQTAKTLSHEVGHLTDYIPEGTLARGNLLGRLASLRHYMSNFLPEKPGGEGELLEKDRARLRRQAIKEAQMPVTVSEEIVVGEIKATPKEIISIWNDATSSIKSPDLLRYIQTLDARQKVEMVKEAMKGKIPAWVTFMNKIKKTITHDVIKNAPEDIRLIYKKLLEEEVDKRRLFQNETIRNELIAITKVWRPYDSGRVSREYIRYRNNSRELYADAISVLFNDPARLERDAPTFFKAFFNYIERKPEFKDNFLAIQDILNKGDEAVFAARDKAMEEAYKKTEEIFTVKEIENRKRKTNLLFVVQSLFDNKNQAIWNKVREAQKKGVKIEDAVNPAYEMQGLNYLDAFTKNFIADTFQPVFEQSQQVQNGWVQLGKILQLERAIYERGELANPQGFDPKTAQEQLNYLQKNTLPEDWTKLQTAKEQFRVSVQKFVDYTEKNEFYTPELLKTMKANPAYSSFQVIDYLDTYVSARVYKQIGTLKDIANTATSTVMKMISVIRAVERNKAKVDMVDFLTDNFSKEITLADTRFAGRNRPKEILEPRDKEKGLVITVREGKLVGHYLDKDIAKSLNNSSNEEIMMAARLSRLISGSPFYRPLFTTTNLGFQTFNFMRDFMRYWKNVPDYTFGEAVTSFPRAIYRYVQAAPHALNRIRSKPDEVIKAMENSKVLGLSFNDIFREPVDPEDMQIERILRKVGIGGKIEHKKLLTPFYWVLERVESLGNFIESLPKIAGYIELKGQGRMSEQEMAQFIRTKLGSPDFRTTGYLTPVSNNILLFSNAIKEGVKSDFQIATGRSETGKFSQSGFWWKTILSNLLPTLIMFGMSIGLLGKWYQDRMNDISEYDKTNYTVIPLGVDETGKTVYLRIPRDETGRLLGGIFHKLLTMAGEKQKVGLEDIFQIFSFGAGQFPNWSPNFTGIGMILQYISGKNPYDSYRGQNLIPEREFGAGIKYSLPIFIKKLLQNQGAGIIIPPYVDTNPGKLQKIIGLPVISNILGRWIKASDYGRTEQLREISLEVKKEKAAQAIEEDKKIAAALKKYNSGDKTAIGKIQIQRKTVKEIMDSLPKEKRTKQKKTALEKEIQITFLKGEADPNLKSLIYAVSNDEKIEILKNLKNNLSQQKFNELRTIALKYKIVSLEVYNKTK